MAPLSGSLPKTVHTSVGGKAQKKMAVPNEAEGRAEADAARAAGVSGAADDPADEARSCGVPPFDLLTREAERGVQGVLRSQLALSAEIERLSNELHRLGAVEQPAIEPFTISLALSRKRVAAVNAALVQVQERLARMDKLAASLPTLPLPREQLGRAEGSATHSSATLAGGVEGESQG